MKPISVTLGRDLPFVRIYPIADVHIGDANWDRKLAQETVRRAADDPNGYVILGGDLVNNAVKTGVSDTYSETMSPMEQLQAACTLLEPVAEKILCAVPGNHEERTYRQDGIDLTALCAKQLGFSNRYRKDFCYLFLSFGEKSRRRSEGRRQSYTVYVNHGNGGGRKIGGKANRLADLGGLCDADLFLVGHTHTPLVFKDTFLRADRHSAGAEFVERTFVNTSACLDYGGYGARQQYQPGSKSLPVITMSGSERKITVAL